MEHRNLRKTKRSFLWGLGALLVIQTFFLFPGKAHADLRLNENDVVVIVLRQNLGVLAASLDPEIADTVITEVRSQFDTLIAGQVRYNLDRSDVESIVFGTDNREILYEAEASKKFPFGMEGRIYLTNKRETTNSAFATDPAYWDTRLGFEARAPFLRNRFGKSDRKEVELAQNQKETVTQSSLAQLDQQVYRAVTTYWNLVASYYYLKLSKQFLVRAKDFLKVTREKKIIGLSEDPDVLAAEALVEERKVEILRAENLIKDFEELLRNQLNLGLSDKLQPTQKLFTKKKIPTKAEIFETALKNRNDYQALLKDAKSKDIEIAISKDQKLPGLDLFTSLELNSVDPNYGTALGQTFSAQNPDWIIGAQFNINYENRQAKSALTRSKLEKGQLLIQIKKLENDIALKIFEALRELRLQRKETIKFARIAGLQKQKVEIEEKNYLQGRSSSDIIVRFQTDWLDAEKQRLDSELREKLAGVDLRNIMSILIPEKLKKLPGEAS
jgi:outer membrane protein TolC